MAFDKDPRMNPMWPRPPQQFRPLQPKTPGLPPGLGEIAPDLVQASPEGSNFGNQQDVPSAFDPTELAPGQGINAGGGWKGPQLNTEAALTGLRNASTQFQGPPRRSTEELYKQAFRPAEQMAPGAGEFARDTLQDRTGADDFARLLGQKEQETVRMSQAHLHPAVQATQEQEARRGAYPAEAQGRSNALSGMFGLQREQARGQATVEAARSRRDQAVQSMLIRELGELTTGGYPGESPDEREDRMGRRDMIQELLNRSRAGEFNLGDFMDDNELQEYLTPQDLEEFGQ